MQVQQDQSPQQIVQDLQQQVDQLTAANLLLQEQVARKEQFIAMVAHELRGPLSPIISYAQMVARPQQRQEVIQRGTSIVMSQARRLARLVNDLLDGSSLSSGKFGLMRSQCDIVALAEEVVEQLRPLAPYHTIILENSESIPITGYWDGGRLQQALGNLLDNAIKYSDERTIITVRIQYLQDAVYVSVHNQGPSIPSTDVAQIFRPYVRLQATSDRQGSGLGLYITKCIVEAHGGVLRLEPMLDAVHGQEAQAGTTFSFHLPHS